MPLISVIIPVYNGAAFIARAVDSVLAQDFSDFEVIVVDDGSTDATGLILNKYGDKIRLLRQDNRGPSAARNAAAATARGEYLAFLDADDWWREDKLTLTQRALESHRTAVLAFSGYRHLLLGETELAEHRYQRAPSLDEMLTYRFDLPPSAVLIRRSVFERCGGFCQEIPGPGFEDTYLWLLAREHGEFIYIDELLMSRQVRANYFQEYWFDNARNFERLVLSRYGQRALPIIQQNNKELTFLALKAGVAKFYSGNPRAALRWGIQAVQWGVQAVRPRS